jgi:transposase-like protein
LRELRSSKYLNNLIEQDHRNVKCRLGAMLGLKSFASAATTIRGFELMHRIRKGQFNLRALTTQGQTPSEIWAAVLTA